MALDNKKIQYVMITVRNSSSLPSPNCYLQQSKYLMQTRSYRFLDIVKYSDVTYHIIGNHKCPLCLFC